MIHLKIGQKWELRDGTIVIILRFDPITQQVQFYYRYRQGGGDTRWDSINHVKKQLDKYGYQLEHSENGITAISEIAILGSTPNAPVCNIP